MCEQNTQTNPFQSAFATLYTTAASRIAMHLQNELDMDKTSGDNDKACRDLTDVLGVLNRAFDKATIGDEAAQEEFRSHINQALYSTRQAHTLLLQDWHAAQPQDQQDKSDREKGQDSRNNARDEDMGIEDGDRDGAEEEDPFRRGRSPICSSHSAWLSQYPGFMMCDPEWDCTFWMDEAHYNDTTHRPLAANDTATSATLLSPASPVSKPLNPVYAPTSSGLGSASPWPYKPTSPVYNLAMESPPLPPFQPRYMPTSPVYSPNSPGFNPTSPVYEPGSPVYDQACPVCHRACTFCNPASPGRSPGFPVYSPRPPHHNPAAPAYDPASPKFSVESPVYAPLYHYPRSCGTFDNDDCPPFRLPSPVYPSPRASRDRTDTTSRSRSKSPRAMTDRFYRSRSPPRGSALEADLKDPDKTEGEHGRFEMTLSLRPKTEGLH